ncbi:hypothetical protein SVA_2661 [Sulfurifustis variabilis]|uniref:Uncharacterized protein n=1 Tax=Sulfurifustis variabilis TaxID=1675686 RepID=A0A1B4V6P2_9GAMM|nr:hypothetical protein [Sulfurifustis variabilis]BAU49209.1 hypothetical protein SVA_2661 [Sulfurifustis variabilis]
MAIQAICVCCGKPKTKVFGPCRACGFLPETEYQMARALILSLTRTVGGLSVGRDASTLKAVAAQIQAGRFYEFDPREEQRAVAAWRAWSAENERRRARRRSIAWTVLTLVLAAVAIAVAAHLT